MSLAKLFEGQKKHTGQAIGRIKTLLAWNDIVEKLALHIGKASLSRSATIAFGLQAFLLIILGCASIVSVSSALGDVADLNGVVKLQRLLLSARLAVVESSDRVKAYALSGNPGTEAAARQAVQESADAVKQAAKYAVTGNQRAVLRAAADASAKTPEDFDRLVQNQNAVTALVHDKIYVEGAAIQSDLNALANHAAGLGEEAAAAKAREASASYSLVRIAMERFISDSSKQNITGAKQQSLALEDTLNEIYAATKNAVLLNQTDIVIKRLIKYDKAFEATVLRTAVRERQLNHLLVGHKKSVGAVVDKIGAEVDNIQSDAASNARLKLGGLLSLNLIIGAAGILFVILGSVVFRRAVTGPIIDITDDMQRLASGELDHEATFTKRVDEIGEMARALEIFRLNSIEVQRLQGEESERVEAQRRADQLARDVELRTVEERQRAQAEAEQAKRRMLVDLATRFENHVSSAMDTVAKAARDIDEGARRVARTVASSKEVAGAVTDAAIEASASTATIASATEEMNLSLAEVSKQVLESSNFASKAVDRVGQTDEIVTSLARDAAEIGEVVSLVHNIAQQVNLLALNATIEASRAGDAGRGFAVVAAEVKSLAQQTAAATAQISERVGSIQNISQMAMQAINEIGDVIGEMGVLAASVAIAVEQQVSTTAEIARNTTSAATGTSQVTSHLKRVQEGVSVSGEAAESARAAAEQVTYQTEALQKEIENFLASVRAA